MGNNSPQKALNPEPKNKNIRYQQIQKAVCEGRRITQRQFREILMEHFYKQADRDSVFANFDESHYPYESQVEPALCKQPTGPLEIIKPTTSPITFTKKNPQETPIILTKQKIESGIMQPQVEEQQKKLEKPTSSSQSHIFSQINMSSILEPSFEHKQIRDLPYKKCYTQLLTFFEDLLKYKYETNFSGEINQICNKNIMNLTEKSSLDHRKLEQNPRISVRNFKNPDESEVDLFKKIMDHFLVFVQRIDKKVHVQFQKIRKTSDQIHLASIQKLQKHVEHCQEQIQRLEQDLQLQHSVLQGFKKKVQKDKVQKQFQVAQEVKELHRIIEYYKNTQSPQRCYNKQQAEFPPESIIHSRKISQDSVLNRFSCESKVKSFMQRECQTEIQKNDFQRPNKFENNRSSSDFPDDK